MGNFKFNKNQKGFLLNGFLGILFSCDECENVVINIYSYLFVAQYI